MLLIVLFTVVPKSRLWWKLYIRHGWTSNGTKLLESYHTMSNRSTDLRSEFSPFQVSLHKLVPCCYTKASSNLHGSSPGIKWASVVHLAAALQRDIAIQICPTCSRNLWYGTGLYLRWLSHDRGASQCMDFMLIFSSESYRTSQQLKMVDSRISAMEASHSSLMSMADSVSAWIFIMQIFIISSRLGIPQCAFGINCMSFLCGFSCRVRS